MYIGTDFETVITDKYMIIFRRNNRENFIESRLYQREVQTYLCIGICQTSPAETEQYIPPMCWRKAFIFHDRVSAERQIYQKDQEIRYDRPPVYLKENDDQIGAYLGTSLEMEEDKDSIRVKFEDETEYSAKLAEAFTEKLLVPDLPSVSDDTIGECLLKWDMGIREEYVPIDGKDAFIGVTINTYQHMYIFQITPHSVYCRAARFAATNKGIVFHQNFRQNMEAYMIKDNSIAGQPLQYDESLFSDKSCVWSNRSVYWSLSSYNENEITLHGCQGEIYHYEKPQR